MMDPARVALAAQPMFQTMLLRLLERARSAGVKASITNAWSSGVEACIRVALIQNAPTAIARWLSAPRVTRNGSERSCDETAVRSFPNLRASAGPSSAAAAVITWASEEKSPVWPLEQPKRVWKERVR